MINAGFFQDITAQRFFDLISGGLFGRAIDSALFEEEDVVSV